MLDELIQTRSIVEILVFAFVFYIVLNFVRGTPAAAMLKGVAFLIVVGVMGLMYLATQFELTHLKKMMELLLSGLFIALVVVFTPEMRRGLTRLSQSSLLSPLFHAAPSKLVEELMQAATRLSKNRIGMLVAIERDVGLGEFVDQGVPINGELSHELLETVFYPGSALHDGAVIVRNDMVAAAGCLFPLTDDPAISKSTGTRHRAAIGISEQTDAIAIVVSEETGKISVAVGGKIHTDLSPRELDRMLRKIYVRTEGSDTSVRLSAGDEGGKS